jgi:amidase
MDWLDNSIMHRRGVARGAVGATHELSEAKQGAYRYTIGPYAEPVLTVSPGDRVIVETLDAFGGVIRSEQDQPSAKLEMPFVNPQNGPIRVEGAAKGDVLAVFVEAIAPRGPQPCGTTCLIPEFGGLTGTTFTALLNDPLPEVVRKVEVDERYVHWSERIKLPYAPFIGTIGVAPELDSISSLTPSTHGGNMDLPDIAPGNVLYLPVRAQGAFLYLGDCHGTQGDGEICGVAIEIPSTTTVRIDVIKDWAISWPRLETAEALMCIGSARPLEDAVRIAYRDLVMWLVAEYGFDKWEAYLLLTQCGRVRLGNVVDPNYTVGASIRKQYLPTPT